ncbi:hypothetical protein L1987_52543 [Smallanthus sonchifolius]|uniref:Uncharacterized protein n=1 Tax=Smallanthus sonchifolius TaxID=185202 RepID=A0ACB9ETJ4_9ASTR|nr:hypothetical protein L1987_52543 [Smallanthus sonchifolius]
MTLEDFFTLNELENGLTTPDRVNELIAVIQSEKDVEVNSFGQTTQQWSKVATIIAATENKDCLDHFIQLNGLIFIDKWLKDAQKLKKDDEDGLLEELIISLLRALEKLQIDDKRLFSSGIMKTVQDLVANNFHTVREKAKELCDNWKPIQDKNKIPQDAKNGDNMELRPPDNSMDSNTKNQEPQDRVDPSSKSTDGDDNGESSSKSGVGKSDVKNENEINFGDKTDLLETSTLCSPSEQIASIADVDNSLESCIKTAVLIDKDDDMADDGEDLKTSSNSDGDNEAGNKIVGVQSNGNSENGSNFLKLSKNSKESDMELDYGMIDPLDIARQVAIEVEREADSRERSCSTSDSKNGQESQSQSRPVDGPDKEVSPEPVKDAETLVSQTSEVAQESELDAARLFSGFDLNQEVCSEDPGTHNNSKQWSGFHDFDLNVDEGGQEDKMVIIPGPPSGEESSVANPRKPERLQWDLNSIGDDQNRWQSPYHASSSSSSLSSSSSSKQPIIRNIDLNLDDQPNGEDSVISIFGARVELKRNDHKPQLEPKFDFNFGRPLDSSMGYGHHNGMFFTMPMYGSSSSHGMPMPMPTPTPTPMPYMVDSRGAPFAPQMMGSQPPSPFLMTMAAAGAPSGATGLGPPAPPPAPPPQHNFDLNTGLLINGGLRQFFPQNVNEQASSSSVLGKRHEPDSNWQFFPVNKRQQPPWR